MANIYDRTDLTFTQRGDFVISHNGDIMDTNNDPLRSLYQEAQTRVKSDLNDWKENPDVGATCSDFIGRSNNKITAELIKTRIISALTRHGFINSRDLKVVYAPIDTDKLAIRISITVAPTAKNRGSTTLGVSLLYNYTENNFYIEPATRR